jgi:ABC-type glycerol-3-phosphate transport system permease component
MRQERPLATVALHAVLAAGAAAAMVPVAMLLWYAFSLDAVIKPGESRLGVHLGNFATLFTSYPMWSWLGSSLFLACLSTALVVMTSCLGGFALAKHRFLGRKPLMWVMLAVMMLPGQVTLPASYELMFHLGWLDSYWALIIPGATSVFGIFLFRAAFQGVPDELLQASRIDGCGELRTWWDIAVPCVRPMIGAFTLLTFTGTWNAFLWPQIILSRTESYTLPIGIATLAGSADYQSSYGIQMAATLLGILPVAAVFIALQRDFVSGLTSGAVKG